MINSRLSLLRLKMKELGIDAFIVPTNDPHQSEYPPEHWKNRNWISGFSGSAGTAVVTAHHAGLWTDSRYFLQAEKELAASEFVLHKIINRVSPGYVQWISENLSEGQKVGIDANLFSYAQQKNLTKILNNNQLQLKLIEDPFDDIWKDRPAPPMNPVFKHDVQFAGQSRTEKINAVRQVMSAHNASHHLISTLDDIAWLLNLRGSDVECNPVFVAYVIIGMEETHLFINNQKLPDHIQADLNKDKVILNDYSAVNTFLQNLKADDAILVDPSTIGIQLYNSIRNSKIVEADLPSQNMKAIKNETELMHIKNCMVKDGIALTHAFFWLEEKLKNETTDEVEFSNKLIEFRSQQDHYYGESFSAIVGYKGNGAIVHYRPEKESCAVIKNEGILLVDSGGQYHDGTTDITRTIALSEPSPHQKNAYTRVLKGHIALANAVFPEGTTGIQMDILARQFLWKDGLNFYHGTGHGVGFFNSVHEAPQGFGPGTSARESVAHVPGMLTSNEPGYYKEGEYGIRIENLIVCVNATNKGYYKFETVTLFPIDTRLIDKTLMNKNEIEWLNDYHQTVYEKLSPSLDIKHSQWLKDKCQKI